MRSLSKSGQQKAAKQRQKAKASEAGPCLLKLVDQQRVFLRLAARVGLATTPQSGTSSGSADCLKRTSRTLVTKERCIAERSQGCVAV